MRNNEKRRFQMNEAVWAFLALDALCALAMALAAACAFAGNPTAPTGLVGAGFGILMFTAAALLMATA